MIENLDGVNDDLDGTEDAVEDETPVAPGVVATDVADLAGCAAYVPTAHIAPDGALLDVQTGQPISVPAISSEIRALLVLSRDANAAQLATIDALCAAAARTRGPAIVLHRAAKTRARRPRRTLNVAVAAEAWDRVVPLACVLLEGFTPRSHRRGRPRASPNHWRVRWMLVDPRPAPMIQAIRKALTGTRIFVGARLPAKAEAWHHSEDFDAVTAADELAFEGDAQSGEVLLVEELPGPAPSEVLHAPEVIPHDPRPFNGRLAFVVDLATAARRIAALHLLHNDDLMTEVLIEQCAQNRTLASPFPYGGKDSDEGRRLALGIAVNRLLEQQVFDLVTVD